MTPNDIGAAAQQAAMQGNMSQTAAREVSVMLKANTGPFQKEMTAAASAVDTLVVALEKVDKAYKSALKSMGKGMIGLGGAMQATAAGSMYSAASFEEMFARVAKTTGLQNTLSGQTGPQADLAAAFGVGDPALQQFENDIRMLSTEIPVAVGELSHLADVAGQLGVEAENLDLFADTAAKLGAGISDLGSDTAIAGLANLSGAFGIAEEKVVNLGSSLAELANHTRGSATEILYFSQRMAGTAVQIGMTAEEVMGLGAAISAIGAQPELGASALIQTVTQINNAIQQGGDEAERFARAMGLSLDQLRSLWDDEGPTAVLLQLLNSLSAQGDQASTMLQKLKLSGVGTTQILGGLAAQIGVVNDALGKSTRAFEEGTAVSDLAGVRFDTLTKKMQRFRQSTSEVFRSMGTGTLVIFKMMVDVVTNVVNLFNQIPQPLKTAMGFIAAIGGAAMTAAGAFTIFFASFHAFFLLVSMAPKVLQAVGNGLMMLGGTAATAGQRFLWLGTVLAKFQAGLAAAKASLLGIGAAFKNAFIQSGNAMKALLSFNVAVNATQAGVTRLSKGIVVGTWHEWVHALKLTGGALMQVGKAATAAGLAIAKALWPMAAIMGVTWGLSKAWGAMRTEADEVTAAFERTAEAADLMLETVEEVQQRLGGERGGDALDLSVEAEPLLDLLDRLDEEQRETHLISYGMQLLHSGNSPSEVQEHIEALSRLAGTPIEFNFTLQDITTGDDFATALQNSADMMERVRTGVERTWGERTFGYGGILGRTPESTIEYQKEFQQQLQQLSLTAGGNSAAKLAQYLDVASDLDRAFASGAISLHEYNDSLRMLDEELGVVREASTGLAETIARTVDHEMSGLDSAVSQAVTIDEHSVNSARATLMRLMEADPVDQLTGDLQRAVLRSVDATKDLNEALDDLSDADLTDLIEQVRQIAIESQVRDVMAQLDVFATELGKRMEMPLATAMDEEAAKRYWDQIRDNFPQEVGLASAIRQADDELRSLIESGEEWGDQADRYRQMLDQWTQAFLEMQIPRLTQELQAVEATDQVRVLEQQLRALGDIPTDIKIQIRATVLQQTYEAEAGGFRQAMGTYDQLLKRREQMEEDHNERLTDLVEDRNRAIADLRESHAERMADIDRAEAEALEARVEQQAEVFDATERLEQGQAQSAARLLANIERQNRAIAAASQGLDKLRSMGISEDVIDALGLNDPRNVDQVERLVTDAMANPSLIDQINAEWAQRLDLSKGFVQRTGAADDIREDFARQRAEAEESLAESIAGVNERYTESVASANEAHAEQIEQIGEQLGELGRTVAETTEELIDRAMNSGIEGLEEWARHVQELQDRIANLGQVPRGVSRDDVAPDVQPSGGGGEWLFSWLDGFTDAAPDVWRSLQTEMDRETSTTMAIVEGIFGEGVDSTLRILDGLSEQDDVWTRVVDAMRTGAEDARDAVIDGLTGTDEDFKEITDTWIERLENPFEDFEIDPVISPSGSPSSQIPMADGGITLPDQATIARGGTLIQWAEPETGGEAFIPLAPGKRERSREIWLKTGQLLGMTPAQAYANGGVRGSTTRGREYAGLNSSDVVGALVKALETAGPRESHSTTYGPIEVKAQDAKDLIRQLDARRRRQRLTGREHSR